ncbi:hypothetical protein D3C80_1764080 [compost metagenome]
MRAYAEPLLQMLGMHQHGHCIVFVVIQSVQNTYTNIIDSAELCPVHRGSMPVIVVFGPVRMQPGISRPVIGLLKKNISPDLRIPQLPVILD